MRSRLAFAGLLAAVALGCGQAIWKGASDADGSGGSGGGGGSGAAGNAGTTGSDASGNAGAGGAAGNVLAGAGGSAGNGGTGTTGSGGNGSGGTVASGGTAGAAGRGGGSGSTGSGGRGAGGSYGGRGGGGRGGSAAGGSGGGGGQLAASYLGCSTVGGIDRIVIAKRDAVRDLCFNLVLDSPGQAPVAGLTLPSGIGLEHASAGAGSPCPTRYAAVSASQVTGSVDFGAGGSGGALPSHVNVDVTISFPNNDAGAPTSERLAAQSVDVEAPCP